MTRTQECRRTVVMAGRSCELEKTDEGFREVATAYDFGEENPDIADLATRALRPLIREKDNLVRAKAISHIRNVLNRKTPQDGTYTKALTEKDVHSIVDIVKSEIKKEIQEKELEKLAKEVFTTTEPELEPEPEKPDTQTTITTEENEPEPEKKYTGTFNKTTDSIEWAIWTWNPVTGCKFGCKYCYARDIAIRYNGNFEPEFHPERLLQPTNTPLPAAIGGNRTVFVCSMADLFGDWVPQKWIDDVLAVVTATPQWTYIFLTKNPKRLTTIQFPDNAWVGTTVDIQSRVKPAEEAFKKINAKVKFLSIEPFMERLTFKHLDVFDWMIIGGRSRSTGMPAGQPEWIWVESVLMQAREKGLKVYFKPNLTVVPKEYPNWRDVIE